MSEWIKCSERLPPPCVRVWAFRQRMPGMARTVEPCFISDHPKECVDDCNITHWQLLMAPEKPND